MDKQDFFNLIYSNTTINEILKENDILEKILINYEFDLLTYCKEDSVCNNCSGLDNCSFTTKGYRSFVEYTNDVFYFSRKRCRFNKVKEIKNSILDSSKDIYQVEDIFSIDKRKNIYIYLEELVRRKVDKGMYLSGEYGCGKTYIMTLLANKLSKLGSVQFVSFPNLMLEFKRSIETNSVSQIVDILKKVDYLIVDDFTLQAFDNKWIRDEIMYSIFEYRFNKKLITCFTSNYTIEDMKNIFETGKYDKIDKMRLLERIKMLSKEFYLDDKNYREI